MLDMSCQGIVIKKLIDDAGTNFYYVFWYTGDDLYDPPFEDITWGADLKLVSRGINNEKRFIVKKKKNGLFTVLVDGEIYRATKSMLEKVDE